MINYSHQETRRVEWIIGIDYGEDYNKVQQIVRDILAEDKRILNEPAPFIALHALDPFPTAYCASGKFIVIL